MNPTQTAIATLLDTSREGFDLPTLISSTGKSETTVRKALKGMTDVVKDESGKYRWTIIAPNEAAIAIIEQGKQDGLDDDEITEQVDSYFDEKLAGEVALEAAETFAAETAELAAHATVEIATRRPYKKNDPEARTVRTNHITKSTLIVMPNHPVTITVNGTEHKLNPDGEEGKWVTYCLTHGTHNSYQLILDAYWASSYPRFCNDCVQLMTPDQIMKQRVIKKSKIVATA